MNKKKKLLSLILSMVMISSLFTVPVQAATKKVANQTKSITMVVNQKKAIKAPVKMTYKSSNPKIATVSSKGVITAKSKGSVVVTGKYKSVKWTYKIKVIAKKAPLGTYVWICDTGKKYHLSKDCSKMNDPYTVTISEAKARGYDACKKCYR